jgi:geranylgeranyl diphosphate synthase type I
MLSSDPSQDLASRLQEMLHGTLQSSGSVSANNPLFQVTGYALANRGKMVRARMLLAACQAVVGDGERALSAAVAVEYLHLGTLIHDDMIDQDELRRGQPAIWRHYSSDMALLSGDFFYFAAFQALARSLDSANAARILEVFSSACMDLCLGQAQEERLAGNCSTRYEDYLDVVRLKTASLFRAALEIGALLGNGTEEQVWAIGAFAQHLGIAFQIADDLLPFTSNSTTIGKPVTSDIKNHRLTAPVLFALADADEADQQTLRAIFELGHFDKRLREAHSVLQTILKRTGAIRKAEQEVSHQYRQACELLQILPPNEGRAQLLLLANQFVHHKN